MFSGWIVGLTAVRMLQTSGVVQVYPSYSSFSSYNLKSLLKWSNTLLDLLLSLPKNNGYIKALFSYCVLTDSVRLESRLFQRILNVLTMTNAGFE